MSLPMLNARFYVEPTVEMGRLFRHHRHLIWEMARREVTDRYTGQFFGVFWAVCHPILLMCLYLFIFAFVFRVRVAGTVGVEGDYSVYLLAGIIPWLCFAEALSKGAVTITGNANLVKQVVFPLEVLPVKSVLASFLTQAVSTLVLAAYVLVKHQALPWTILLLPLLFFLQFLFLVGLALMLGALTAFFRDIKDFIQVYCAAGIYLMPVVYLPEMVPAMLRPLLYANPLSYMTWCYQDACFYGRIEHPLAWVVFPLLSGFVFCAGSRLFRVLKILFGNVL
jgi:lipopolysaccharide transport system permease protein